MEQEELTVPMSAVSNTLGCAFDIGGTQCKVVYKPKEPSRSGEECKLQLLTTSTQQFEDCLDHVKSHADLDSKSSIRVVHTTGVGVRSSVKSTIFKELQARVENLVETTCLGRAFMFLVEHFPKEAVVLPPPELGYRQGLEIGKRFLQATLTVDARAREENEAIQQRQQSESAAESKPSTDHEGHPLPYKLVDPHLFPCLISSIGSGGNLTIVDAGGYVRLANGIERAGKYLMGLSSLVLDVRNYDELMALAEKGDDHNVNIYMKDLKVGEDSDFYSLLSDEMLGYVFGKAADQSRSNFKREDVARALVTSFVSDFSQQLFWVAKAHGCKRVFVAGGVNKHSLVRNGLMRDFTSRNMSKPVSDSGVELHFLRNGLHVVALGALLENEKYYSKK